MIAFEASPRTAGLLWRSVLINGLEGRFHLYVNGVTDYVGVSDMVIPSFNQGGGRLSNNGGSLEQMGKGDESLQHGVGCSFGLLAR